MPVTANTQLLHPNATPGGASTIHTEYLTHFRWKVVCRSNYPVHAVLPSKRYASQRIYYPRRIPYSFLLEGSPEVELSCPRSASVQTLRQAGHLLSTQNTLPTPARRQSGGRTTPPTQRFCPNTTPGGACTIHTQYFATSDERSYRGELFSPHRYLLERRIIYSP